MMKFVVVLLIVCAGAGITFAEPTARTYSFAAFEAYFHVSGVIDSLAKHFDLVYAPETIRFWNPKFRDSAQVEWRRDKPPLLLMYKDAMTLKGPRYIVDPETSDTIDIIPADSTRGGGHTVGGFWHFDSILKQNFPSDTLFMLATTVGSHQTSHYDTIVIGNDTIHRVHAGSNPSWQWRWAMDYGRDDWQTFYGCSTKVQCLRNSHDLSYDSTYFDGVFIDNLLMWRGHYGMYPLQYPDESSFRAAVHSFAQTVTDEYHNPDSPANHPCEVLALANLNYAFSTPNYDSIWKMYLNCLDGGQEETYFAGDTLDFDTWHKFIHEIAIAESLGKMCIVRKAVKCNALGQPPFNVGPYNDTSMIFGFASYLMAYDSVTYFGFSSDSGGREYAHIYWAPILDIDLGKPMETYKINISAGDTFVYRHYEEGLVFANPRKNSPSTAGFPGDTLYELGPLCDIRDTIEGQFTLNYHNGKICLYPPNYFHGSGFEPDDRLCWEDYCLGAQGITNHGAKRVLGVPPNGVTPPAG
ncbi:hypothetical protein IBX73_11095, partial [candidate division WOR-3 bacterium]|nr:hypothetical protein [candidate division WOR-3 bacterium]